MDTYRYKIKLKFSAKVVEFLFFANLTIALPLQMHNFLNFEGKTLTNAKLSNKYFYPQIY